MKRSEMCRTAWLLLLMCVCLPAYAEKYRSVRINGRVVDSSTGNPLSGVTISVLRPDSSVVLEHEASEESGYRFADSFSFRIEKTGDYILRFIKKGYEPLYCNYHLEALKATEDRDLGTFSMRRKGRVLKGVTVRATKIKMVMKGDTLVYNADAFELAEGSMLDALVRQLPGAELKDGQIKVNGELVSSLLLNGKDFFKGNPKAALENLPAYMVKDVKVYRREDEGRRHIGVQTQPGTKELVMDVGLKRQYNTGYIANAEMGGGTDGRYLSRIFGMRFTDRTKLFAFARMNNTNDTRLPGNDGEWSPQGALGGKVATKTGGMQFGWNNKAQTLDITAKVIGDHSNTDSEMKVSSENYLASGNTYGRSSWANRGTKSSLQTSLDIMFKPKKWYVRLLPYLNVNEDKNRNRQASATFSAKPYESYRGAAIDSLYYHPDGFMLADNIVNTSENVNYGRIRNLQTGLTLLTQTEWKKWSFDLTAYAYYTDQSYPSYNHYSLSYGQGSTVSDFRNRYNDNPFKYYRYYGNFTLDRTLGDFYLCFSNRYTQTYSSNNYSRYRFEHLDGWGYGTDRLLGELPATDVEMNASKDWFNSTNGHILTKEYKPQYTLFFQKLKSNADYPGTVDWFRITTSIQLKLVHDEAAIYKNRVLESAGRSAAFLEPEIKVENYKNADAVGLSLSYNLDHSLATLTDRLDVCYNYDPLRLKYGNPGLRNRLNHNFKLNGSMHDRKKQRGMSGHVAWRITERGQANALVYDSHTGISQVRPVNVNGNWNLSADCSAYGYLDKKKHLHASMQSIAEYEHSADYLQEGTAASMTRNSLRNLTLNEGAGINYSYGKYTVGGKVVWKYMHTTASREGFSPINVSDLTYTLGATLPLPCDIQLGTDLTLYTRYGYGDKEMNAGSWVWNARLSRAFMQKRLTVMLDVFDILNDVKNVQRSLSAMGRTETWYNSINRYLMLHLVYKFSTSEKKKK